jgi:hypothetical protein
MQFLKIGLCPASPQGRETLSDALGICSAIIAARWPERVPGLVSVSGYLIGSQAAGRQPLPPQAELQW